MGGAETGSSSAHHRGTTSSEGSLFLLTRKLFHSRNKVEGSTSSGGDRFLSRSPALFATAGPWDLPWVEDVGFYRSVSCLIFAAGSRDMSWAEKVVFCRGVLYLPQWDRGTYLKRSFCLRCLYLSIRSGFCLRCLYLVFTLSYLSIESICCGMGD